MKILDVSEYQGTIDWKKVKAAGVQGVIIRAGWGKGNQDPKFAQNAQGAIAEGLNVGIYWFSYAYTVQMARQEAIYCHAVIAPYKEAINLPVFFDWEYDSMRWAEKNGVKPGKGLITAMIAEFCAKATEIGWKAGYYLNQDYSKNYVNEANLRAYRRWFAKYTTTEQKDCYLWQYTSKGTIEGVKGSVDVNRLWDLSDVHEVAPVQQDEAAEGSQGSQGSQGSDAAAGMEEEYDMRTIKKGSRGKAVKVWQVIVGETVDGIFGAKTHEATLDFQRRKGLVQDGIVGKLTWKAGLESV